MGGGGSSGGVGTCTLEGRQPSRKVWEIRETESRGSLISLPFSFSWILDGYELTAQHKIDLMRLSMYSLVRQNALYHVP